MKLTSFQRAIVIGLIIGDGCLQKTGKSNARLRLEHGFKQKEYLFWKAEQLQTLFQGKPKFLERKHPLTGRIYKYWRYQSNSGSYLGKLRKKFYSKNRKIIPLGLAKLLKSPISLAVWYMDDGYYYSRDRCSYIYLGRINKEEAKIAAETLRLNFDLLVRILDKKKKGFVLYFPPEEVLKLKKIIKDYTLPIFDYKLPS